MQKLQYIQNVFFSPTKLLLLSISTSILLVFYSNYSLIISEIIHNYECIMCTY